MSCRTLPKIPNPVKISQKIYGVSNVNDVRDSVVNSLRRFYGYMCDFDQRNIYYTIQTYMIKILEDAGRNPKAVKLALPPVMLEPSIFQKRYFETNFDKDKAFRLALKDCDEYPPGISEKNALNCYIDYHSV
jgi:hypothetical protein